MSAVPPPPPTATIGASSWEVVDEGPLANALRAQLADEVGPNHILYRVNAVPLTRCRTCGAVGLHTGNGRFAIVELTSSGQQEVAPRPMSQRFETFDALRETLNRHHHR